MPVYSVHLFRSGRVYIAEGAHPISKDVDPPLVSELVEIGDNSAASPLYATAVLGKLLLQYVDRANQPTQHICLPCGEPCCTCMCGLAVTQHTHMMSPAHSFTPMADVSHGCPPCPNVANNTPHADCCGQCRYELGL